MITKSEAIKIMTDNGFVVTESEERYAKITDGRDQVGILWGDRVILYIDEGYKNPIDLWYNKMDVKKKLKESISLVKKRYDRFEDDKRKERLSTVCKYFKDREDTEFAKSLHDADRS